VCTAVTCVRAHPGVRQQAGATGDSTARSPACCHLQTSWAVGSSRQGLQALLYSATAAAAVLLPRLELLAAAAAAAAAAADHNKLAYLCQQHCPICSCQCCQVPANRNRLGLALLLCALV